MGAGDELMLSGEARLLQQRDPRPVGVYRRGAPYFHWAWDHNPRFASIDDMRRGRPHQRYDLGMGRSRRPYACPVKSTAERWSWTSWRAVPGEIYFGPDERALAQSGARDFVVIEPHIKPGAPVNKDWGFARYQAVVAARPDLPWVQFDYGRPLLRGVRPLRTRHMRQAFACLSRARAYVGPEGGLHHAAAALTIPGVVIFGGYISPASTGYDIHRNIFTGGQACGWRTPCAHCAAAMDAIAPQTVIENLEAVLGAEIRTA
jgi:hypothetical protein